MTTATVVRYEPRGAARELFRNRDSETVMAGAAGTGKSLACLFRVHLAALSTPGIRCLIARKTGVSLGSTTLVTFEKKVAAAALASGVVAWFGGSAREAPSYRYSNGSTINVGGLDKPEKVLSSEYDLIFVDEATEITITDWETLGTRLRNGVLSWQQQLAACNPVHPTHWIKQRANAGSLTLLTSLHRDNPAYVNADGTLTKAGTDYMAKLDALTGVRRLRLRDGIWAAAEGLVYEDFNPALHVVKREVVQPGWTRWWTVDFGYTNPFVWQEWAEDPDGRLYLYREIYKTKTLVEDHARAILQLVAPGGRWASPRPRAIICDHDAEDRATLERHLSMGTSAAHKTVKDGIQATQSRFRPAGDGRPRLFICEGARVDLDTALAEAKKPTCTEEEAVGYVWEPPRAGGQPKEQPVKQDDHGMDAMRYIVAERDLGSRPRVRWM
ncbi:phage terminase large subunit [Kitasatospora griseola]|uniref:phage terminase large subunit n=1 Tax=Kitasatospora griseola TaxID=2064 RepID=UPI00366352A8